MVSPNFDSGTIQLDLGEGLNWYPYYDSYVRVPFQVKVESGEYDEILKTGRLPAEEILTLLQMKLRMQEYYVPTFQAVNASLNSKWNITSSPVNKHTGYYSTASVIVTLDIIARYVELQGGIMTAVEITVPANLRHKGNPNPEIDMSMSIARPDHVVNPID